MEMQLSGSLQNLHSLSSVWEWHINDSYLYVWFSDAQIYHTIFAYVLQSGNIKLLTRVEGNLAIDSFVAKDACEAAKVTIEKWAHEEVLRDVAR